MKKRPLRFTIGTVLAVVACLLAAVVFWLFVRYNELSGSDLLSASVKTLFRYLT